MWTDSTTALQCLNSTSKLPVFVANRVSEILESTTIDEWFHVSSGDNPEDTGTRGITAEALKKSVWDTEYEENGTIINDVALLKLERRAPRNSEVLPLCTKDYTQSRSPLKLAGMGRIYQGSRTAKPNPRDLELQEVELTETTDCPKLWESHAPVAEMEVCMLGNNKSGCYGDSGGPLFPVDKDDKAMCLYGTLFLDMIRTELILVA
ncbi:phenoloxidase-activating factor 3-like [Symsagittifera roscoffensis]|uniref:phenoloxidase-activating factor 3-like n=1 Tax=Symsagittifera roscoffensis TaxID=84072 RepID=UPI00307BEDEB